ncbi:tol-pal system protein YbgF [Paenochrobactrum sp. BZR 588]|uniref:tol-pal system protein YbgF n=1 Tax=Paenochrobactrum TaxID=999488 RepID=UPI0035BC4F04
MKTLTKHMTITVAMLSLLASSPVFAAGAGMRVEPVRDGLVQLAQAADPRVSQLQEQVRDLSGKLEELNFQILQMQEQMRKQQEDNEYRFEELEKKKQTDAGGASGSKAASVAPSTQKDMAAASEDAASTSEKSTDANSADSVAIGSSADHSQQGSGTPPRQLGSIRMDANGNVIGETMDVEPESVPEEASRLGRETASIVLPDADNPNALYEAAYQYILSGDYKAAEAGFRAHIDRYPADPMTADARYWLGEALLGQKRLSEAASVFIDTQRDYPDSKRGAENMLKLGITLQAMGNHDVACATFAQIPSRYPSSTPAVMASIDKAKAASGC